MQAEARVGAEASAGLEPERGPVVRVVPVRDRSEQRDRDQDGEIGLRAKEPAARTPIQDAERQRGEAQREDGVLREQPEAEPDSRAVPRPALLPDERPVEEIQRRRPRDGEGCVRGGHQARREEGIRNRRGERRRHERGGAVHEAPGEPMDEVDDHDAARERDDAHARLAVPEEHLAERDQPRHHRRMVEVPEVGADRVVPVVGFLGREREDLHVQDVQQEHAAHDAHRGDTPAQRRRRCGCPRRTQVKDARSDERAPADGESSDHGEPGGQSVGKRGCERAAAERERERRRDRVPPDLRPGARIAVPRGPRPRLQRAPGESDERRPQRTPRRSLPRTSNRAQGAPGWSPGRSRCRSRPEGCAARAPARRPARR